MSAADASPPRVSVVIPAYRTAATIGDCLESLAAQRDAPRFEVIVVDSSPDGETQRVALAFARPDGALDLRCERLAHRAYPGTARNHGAGLARAPVLLFLDADCIAASDLVATASRAIESEGGIVAGSIALVGAASASARLRHLLEFKEALPGTPRRRTWMLPSACIAFERRIFAKHGGFPDVRASEDWLLDWRMWQAGETMFFDPSLAVTHRTPSGWRALVRYSRLLGFASGAARRRGGLPGQALVRWPVLAVGLPIARTVRALVWCARYARREVPFLLVFWPAYLAVASVWAFAFQEGVRRGVPEESFPLATRDTTT